MHWIIIIIGILILSASVSNPFYKIIVIQKMNLNINKYLVFFLRILLFLIAIGVIFLGLYMESI